MRPLTREIVVKPVGFEDNEGSLSSPPGVRVIYRHGVFRGLTFRRIIR